MAAKLVILFLLIDLRLGYGILGGHFINIEDAPHSVNYGDICGGVIISKKWILTAAHCGLHNFVRIGSKYRLKKLKIAVRRHLIHPFFQRRHEFGFDIQLLEIPRRLMFNPMVDSVGLWNYGDVDKINVTGWGFEREKDYYTNVLKQVEMHVVRKEICQMVEQRWYNYSLTEEMFCAGNHTNDACQGDSGGGATVGLPGHQSLVGIASFGYGCGRTPGVYINVSNPAVFNWIQGITGWMA